MSFRHERTPEELIDYHLLKLRRALSLLDAAYVNLHDIDRHYLLGEALIEVRAEIRQVERLKK